MKVTFSLAFIFFTLVVFSQDNRKQSKFYDKGYLVWFSDDEGILFFKCDTPTARIAFDDFQKYEGILFAGTEPYWLRKGYSASKKVPVIEIAYDSIAKKHLRLEKVYHVVPVAIRYEVFDIPWVSSYSRDFIFIVNGKKVNARYKYEDNRVIKSIDVINK